MGFFSLRCTTLHYSPTFFQGGRSVSVIPLDYCTYNNNRRERGRVGWGAVARYSLHTGHVARQGWKKVFLSSSNGGFLKKVHKCARCDIWALSRRRKMVLFVCLYNIDQGHNFCINCWDANVLCAEFVSPDALLDLGFWSRWLETPSRLGAPVSWEMSLGDEHRNRTLQLQLGHTFHGFLLSPRVFGHQQIINGMEPALLLFFLQGKKPLNSFLNSEGKTFKMIFWTFE